MVYFFDDYDSLSDDWLDSVLLSMPAIRREKVNRLKQSRDRANAIIAYAILQRYADTDLSSWQIDDNGKPYIPDSAVHFSISHTDNGVAVAISDDEIGVDIQSYRDDCQRIISRVCSLSEQQSISSAEDFIRYWAIKESYVKYNGTGIADDLRQYCFVDCAGDSFEKYDRVFSLFRYDGGIIAVCSKREEKIKEVRFD